MAPASASSGTATQAFRRGKRRRRDAMGRGPPRPVSDTGARRDSAVIATAPGHRGTTPPRYFANATASGGSRRLAGGLAKDSNEAGAFTCRRISGR